MILSFSVQIYLQKSAKCLTHFAPLLKQPERFPAKRRLHLRRGKNHFTEFRHGSVLLPESFRMPLRRRQTAVLSRANHPIRFGCIYRQNNTIYRMCQAYNGIFAQICNPLPQNLLNCVIDFYWKSVILKPYKQHKQRSICHVRKLSGYHRLCCRF